MPSRAAAQCVCAEVPACEAYQSADAIFIGRAANGDPDQVTTEVKVERTLKGSAQDFVDYPTEHLGDSECAPVFHAGKEYLVYAHRHDNVLTTSICERNPLLEEAQLDLNLIAARSADRVDAIVYGSVTTESTAGEFRISLDGVGQRRVQMLRPYGMFQFAGLPPGRYRLRIDGKAFSEQMSFELEARACVSVGDVRIPPPR